MARPSKVDDRGETLVELMITLVIMSTAVIALVTGIGAAIKISDIHRKQATAGAYVRDFADSVETYVASSPTGYTTCSTAIKTTYEAAYTVPSTNYTRHVIGLAFWDTSTTPPSWKDFTAGCPSNGDSGLERVSLQVASNDVGSARATETLDIVIRQPCRSTDPTCT